MDDTASALRPDDATRPGFGVHATTLQSPFDTRSTPLPKTVTWYESEDAETESESEPEPEPEPEPETEPETKVDSETDSSSCSSCTSSSSSSSKSKDSADTIRAENEIEADADYVAPQSLLRAVNDAKALWVSFRTRRSALDATRAKPGTFEIFLDTSKPSPSADSKSAALQLRAVTRDGSDVVVNISASETGEWFATAVADTAGKVNKEESLHMLLVGLRKHGLLTAARQVLPSVETYIWLHAAPTEEDAIVDVHARRQARHERNVKTYNAFVIKRGDDVALLQADTLFQIVPAPYKQPHVVLATVRARVKTGRRAKGVPETYGVAIYVLGYHRASRTWFLTPPTSPLAYMSNSLDALLDDGIASDAVVTLRKQRNDKGVPRKQTDTSDASHEHKHHHRHDDDKNKTPGTGAGLQ
jgi:hypothetical protein